MKILILTFVLPLLAFAQEYPYSPAPRGYTENQATKVVISPNTPIKSQDGIGLCYGFTATSLLEHYRCKELGLDCSDPKEQLSSLDVTSYYRRKELVEGGDTFSILSNIESSSRKIVREECAKYSDLVYEVSDPVLKRSIKDESRGWWFLVKKWKEYKGLIPNQARNNCADCLVNEIKNELCNVQTPAEQLKDAFITSSTLEQFLYKSILPVHCLQNESKKADIPKFISRNYPGYRDTLSAEGLNKKIQSLLLAKVPLEMAICTEPAGDGTCVKDNGHSIALFGIKEVCRGNDCRVMVQVKNSYGASWQSENKDGWVDLDQLVESSLMMTKHRNISWIERPGFVLPEKTLSSGSGARSTTTTITFPKAPAGNGAGIPPEYRDHRGIWKCPGSKFVQQYEAGCVPYK